jgi:hypothetical protein
MWHFKFKLHFKRILITYVVNNFEMMDDFTFLTMKLFEEN